MFFMFHHSKALSNDIEKNLQAPLLGIAEELAAMGERPTTFVRRSGQEIHPPVSVPK